MNEIKKGKRKKTFNYVVQRIQNFFSNNSIKKLNGFRKLLIVFKLETGKEYII